MTQSVTRGVPTQSVGTIKVKWMLRQVELSRAKDLLAELMTIDNPQVIHSSLQLALKNLGLTRMINPASAKTL